MYNSPTRGIASFTYGTKMLKKEAMQKKTMFVEQLYLYQ